MKKKIRKIKTRALIISNILLLIFLIFQSCSENKKESGKMITNEDPLRKKEIVFDKGYSDVNSLRMYYEIHGEGKPLVLIHGGGSTIQTSFGRIIPELSRHRKIIAMELQAHGRTNDRNTNLSFEQDADDVVTLLNNLGIPKADFFGFSNGGNTTMQIAIRHPGMVHKIIIGSAFYQRNGLPPGFHDFMKNATLDNMPDEYKKAYKAVAPDKSQLQTMHDKCARRMIEFTDWSEDDLKLIKSPSLIVIGDKDVVTPEHAVEMSRLIPDCSLAVLPGGHGEYMEEITFAEKEFRYAGFMSKIILDFLDEKYKSY